MEANKYRLPLLSLDNEYTYLKKEPHKNSSLIGLSQELSDFKKLPNIKKKHLKTSRKPATEYFEIASEPQNRVRNLYSEHRQPNRNMYPIYIPMPMPSPMQTPFFLPFVPMFPHNTPMLRPSYNKGEEQPETKKETETAKKEILKMNVSKKLGRKFKAAAIAVYFCLYFRNFSKKFTELRRNWFNERYTINNGKIIMESSEKILKKLYEVDLYKMYQTSKQKPNELDSNDNQQKENRLEISELLHPKNDINSPLMNFITLIIDYAQEFMTEPQFILEHHEVFTVGILHQNFMMTNLYLPQEAALLHVHKNGYIQVREEVEIILIMMRIILKILVYNFLLNLRYSRQWNNKQEKTHGLNEMDLEEIWGIARKSGIFLEITCEEIYDKAFEEISANCYPFNFEEMGVKLGIFPAKPLEEMKKNKNNANPNDIQSKLIMNLEGYSEMKTLINNSLSLKRFKDQIKFKIIDFLTLVYTELKHEEEKVYKFIRNLTLDEKYLILKKNQSNDGNKKKGKKLRLSKGKNQPQLGEELLSKSEPNYSPKNNYDFHKISESSNEDDENENEREGKKRQKLMRFKHEQAFFDHKFDGHLKLERLKDKLKRK